MTRLALLHPPALSPVVWRPLQEVLHAAGHAMVAPDYTPALTVAASWWRRATIACVTAIDALVGNPPPQPRDREGPRTYRAKAPGPDVLVAFSGSGPLLPLVAAARPPAHAVFIDAGLPAAHGRWTEPSPQVQEMVAALPRDGDRLPPWTQWWGQQTLCELVPDPVLRAELDSSAPRLPTDFYAEPVGMAPGWEPPRLTYLQLTPAYDADAAEAARRGWEVLGIDGATHLSVLTQPERIARTLGLG